MIRLDQFHVADAEHIGDLEERFDARVALTPLKIADVLLAHTRALGDLLLRQA